MSASSGLLASFTGALQASLSVLLTLSIGVIAARFGLIDDHAAKKLSSLCVSLFLPALLIVNVGKEIGREGNDKTSYAAVFIWSLGYTFVSALIGNLTTRALSLPAWVTTAICFNNTTSLPLLLVQSLEKSGFLKQIILQGSQSEAVNRAKSFFLINALTSNSLTFAIGPTLLEYGAESINIAEWVKDDNQNGDGEEQRYVEEDDEDEERAIEDARQRDEPTESDSLLPDRIVKPIVRGSKKTESWFMNHFEALPTGVQNTLKFLVGVINAPLIGAIIAIIIGLSPPLHKAFFADPGEGGVFTSWLTSAIENIGELFTSLQMFVVGVKLNKALEAKFIENGEEDEDGNDDEDESSHLHKRGVAAVFTLRFVLWAALSDVVIWVLGSKTGVLGDDPVLWFTMMLMPVGPPAIVLASLAEYKDEKEPTKLAIAKMLCIQYLLTPLMCFPVVGALKLTQNIMEQKKMV